MPVTLSGRSRLLLLGSTLAPIAVGIVRLQYWQTEREARAGGGFVLDFHPAHIFTVMVLAGLACFVGALVSLILDIVRTSWMK